MDGGAGVAPTGLPAGDGVVVRLGAGCDLVPPSASTASPGSISFDVHEFADLRDGRRVVLHHGSAASGRPAP